MLSGLLFFIIFKFLLAICGSESFIDEDAKKLEGIQLVNYINNKQSLWKAKFHPRFQSLSKDMKKGFYGARMGKMSEVRKFLRLPINEGIEKLNDDIPTYFDARKAWPLCQSIGNIRDQSSCGSCWAFGAVEAITDRICIASQGKLHVTISAADLLSCCSACGEGCNGGDPMEAWKFWKNNGIVSGGDFVSNSGCKPYPFPPCAHHSNNSFLSPCPQKLYPTPQCTSECSKSEEHYAEKYYGQSAYLVEQNENAIQLEIMTNGPVEAAFDVFSDFEMYSNGIYHHVAGEFLGGHAIKIIGWGEENGEKYWKIANSWNSRWGENGYFRIRRGVNECGIESYVTAGIPKL